MNNYYPDIAQIIGLCIALVLIYLAQRSRKISLLALSGVTFGMAGILVGLVFSVFVFWRAAATVVDSQYWNGSSYVSNAPFWSVFISDINPILFVSFFIVVGFGIGAFFGSRLKIQTPTK